MTNPMPDSDLADLRNTLERATLFIGGITGRHIRGDVDVTLCSIDIDDVRALVARLDFAEKRRGELAKVCGHQISTELNTHFRAAGITPEEVALADVFARRLREVAPDLVEAIRAEAIKACVAASREWIVDQFLEERSIKEMSDLVATWIEERVKP